MIVSQPVLINSVDVIPFDHPETLHQAYQPFDLHDTSKFHPCQVCCLCMAYTPSLSLPLLAANVVDSLLPSHHHFVSDGSFHS
ncbi:hypothetical protein EMCRGX_G023031 [Ephydatia muelleri]